MQIDPVLLPWIAKGLGATAGAFFSMALPTRPVALREGLPVFVFSVVIGTLLAQPALATAQQKLGVVLTGGIENQIVAALLVALVAYPLYLLMLRLIGSKK